MVTLPWPENPRLFTLVQIGPFEDDWADLGLDNEDLRLLEFLTLSAPSSKPIIVGTGGARKFRFAPRGWNVGKSGAVRVIYAVLAEFGYVLLITAYAKNEQDNLSPDQRNAIHKAIDRIEKALRSRSTRYGPHQ